MASNTATEAPGVEAVDLKDLHDVSETHDELSAPQQYPSGLRFVLLGVGLILGIFVAALDANILATSIPAITDHFGMVKAVIWYSSSYGITNASFQPAWGKAFTLFPMLHVFAASVGLFEVGNVVAAVAQNSNTLIVGRIVSGLGGGGVLTGCFTMLAMSVQPKYRAAVFGIVGVTFGCASVAGPLLGGFLTDGPGWRWCFWINLPIGFAATAVLALTFRQPAASRPAARSWKAKVLSLDLVGALLVTGALTVFIVAMDRGRWSSWQTILSLVAVVLLTALLVADQWLLGEQAMIQGHLLKKRVVVINLFYQFFMAGLIFPLAYALSIQFQSISNVSATQSGIRLIPLMLGVSVVTMVANGLLTYYRRFTPFLVFGAVIGTVGVGLMHMLGADASVGIWIGFEIIVGLGVGMALQVPMVANQAAVGLDDLAHVTSLTLFFENVGTAVFISATEAAFKNGLINALPSYAPQVSPEKVLETGATEIRKTFGATEVKGILKSYLQGCRDSQLVPLSCGVMTVLVSLALAYPSVVKKVKMGISKST